MNQKELTSLQEIYNQETWLIRQHLADFISTVEIGEPLTRTSPQNRALHLYFKQIAAQCRDAGIDSKLLMSKTISVEVNLEIIKGMWKALQQSLYKTKSTTQLKKTGEIDKLQDHFIRFFAENFNLTLPPFPHEDVSKLKNIEAASRLNYPTDYKTPTI